MKNETFIKDCAAICVLVSNDFNVLLCNKAAESFFGQAIHTDADDIPFLNCCNSTQKIFFQEGFSKALRGEETEKEFIQTCPDEKTKFWNMQFAPVYNKKNRLTGATLIGENITACKLLQAKVAEQFQLLKEITLKQSHMVMVPLLKLQNLLFLLQNYPLNTDVINLVQQEFVQLKTGMTTLSNKASAYLGHSFKCLDTADKILLAGNYSTGV
jgi:hypothetical protein